MCIRVAGLLLVISVACRGDTESPYAALPIPICLPDYNSSLNSTATANAYDTCTLPVNYHVNGNAANGDKFCTHDWPHETICGIGVHDGEDKHGIRGIMVMWCNGKLSTYYGNPTLKPQTRYPSQWFNTTASDPIVRVKGCADTKWFHSLTFWTKTGKQSINWGAQSVCPPPPQGDPFDHDLQQGLVGIFGTSAHTLNSIGFKYRCKKQPVPPAPHFGKGKKIYDVALRECGDTSTFQSWRLSSGKGLVRLQPRAQAPFTPRMEDVCLSEDVGSVFLKACDDTDMTQLWIWDGHLLKSVQSQSCLQLETTDSDKPLVLGPCSATPTSTWFYDRLAYPLDLIRTMASTIRDPLGFPYGFAATARRKLKPTLPPTPKTVPQRKCLSATRGPMGSQCKMRFGMTADDKGYELLGMAASAAECCELCSSYTGPAWAGPESKQLGSSTVHWKCRAFIYEGGMCKGMKGPLKSVKKGQQGSVVGVAPVDAASSPEGMGPAPPGGQSICELVTRLVPEMDIPPFSGPMKGPCGGVQLHLSGLAFQLPLTSKFQTCSIFNPQGPTVTKAPSGSLVLSVDIFQMPFILARCHFDHGAAGVHATLTSEGFVRTKLDMQVKYTLHPPRISCSFLNFEIPEVDMSEFGGGPFHKCADGMKWNIAETIQTIMPDAAAHYLAKYCPSGKGVAIPQCGEAAKQGPLEMIKCFLTLSATLKPGLQTANLLV